LQYRELFKNAKQKTDELSLLHELQHAISSQLELEQLFDVSLQKIIDIFNYSFVHLRVLENEHLNLVAHKGFEDFPLSKQVSIGDKAAKQLLNGSQYVLINHENYSEYLGLNRKEHIQSLILVPIYANQEFFGTLAIGNQNSNLEEKDLQIILKVVELIAVVIENAQLHEQVKRDLRRNESLHKISQAVQEHNNLNELMDNIVEYVRQAMNARWAILYKINLRKKCIESVSNTDLERSPLKVLDFDELTSGLGGWAIRNKKVAFTRKGIVDERESPEISQRIIDLDIGSVAVIPFLNGSIVEGSIAVINHIDDANFSDNDLQLLNTVANQVGEVIGKHKLMRQIEHQAFHDSLTNLPNRLQFESGSTAKITICRTFHRSRWF